jgi:hypothetical protein
MALTLLLGGMTKEIDVTDISQESYSQIMEKVYDSTQKTIREYLRDSSPREVVYSVFLSIGYQSRTFRQVIPRTLHPVSRLDEDLREKIHSLHTTIHSRYGSKCGTNCGMFTCSVISIERCLVGGEYIDLVDKDRIPTKHRIVTSFIENHSDPQRVLNEMMEFLEKN